MGQVGQRVLPVNGKRSEFHNRRLQLRKQLLKEVAALSVEEITPADACCCSTTCLHWSTCSTLAEAMAPAPQFDFSKMRPPIGMPTAHTPTHREPEHSLVITQSSR